MPSTNQRPRDLSTSAQWLTSRHRLALIFPGNVWSTNHFLKRKVNRFTRKKRTDKLESLVESNGISRAVRLEASCGRCELTHQQLGHSVSDITQHPSIFGPVGQLSRSDFELNLANNFELSSNNYAQRACCKTRAYSALQAILSVGLEDLLRLGNDLSNLALNLPFISILVPLEELNGRDTAVMFDVVAVVE